MPTMMIWDANEFTPSWNSDVEALGVAVRVPQSEAEALEAVAEAEIFYGNPTPQQFAAARKLKWVQSKTAGLDGFWFPALRSSSVTVTNLRGIYSDIIAEHVFGYVLSFARGLHIYRDRQRSGAWQEDLAPVMTLPGKTMGIVGLGGIGLAVAERAHAFGLRVVGLDPAPKGQLEFLEQVYGGGEIAQLLEVSDFVVICVPHTAETEFLLNRKTLTRMKRSAILINIGRGKVVELAALTECLEAGRLAGAALDVFESEPLAPDHPLWQMENVIVTPHVAAISDEILPRREALILENVRRFVKGEGLLNVVDHHRGYVI